MKGKIVSASLASLLLMGVPAFAASVDPAPSNNPSQSSSDHGNDVHQAALRTIQNAAQTMKQVKADPHFADLLHRARGVFIVPHLVKGAAIVGGEGGSGVLMARKNEHWSDPAFLSIGSISVGAQVGGEAGPLVMLLMTSKALHDFTSSSNFSLNANAGLSIVNYSAKGQGGFGKGDVVVWSGASGAFIGASISGSDITVNRQRDNAFYARSNLTTEQIINGHARSAAADQLVNELSS